MHAASTALQHAPLLPECKVLVWLRAVVSIVRLQQSATQVQAMPSRKFATQQLSAKPKTRADTVEDGP
jgi:hypothetical protein